MRETERKNEKERKKERKKDENRSKIQDGGFSFRRLLLVPVQPLLERLQGLPHLGLRVPERGRRVRGRDPGMRGKKVRRPQDAPGRMLALLQVHTHTTLGFYSVSIQLLCQAIISITIPIEFQFLLYSYAQLNLTGPWSSFNFVILKVAKKL